MQKATKILGVLFTLLSMVGVVMATPIIQVPLIGDNPIYDEGKFTPLVFLSTNGGRLLYDDPYGFWANGNIQNRMNNYAFTGERIEWKVLVWDKNGMPEKIKDVWAGWTTQTNGPTDPDKQVNCQLVTTLPPDGTKLASMGYADVRRPNDQEAQVNFNPSTMREYVCRLTIEPTCQGQKWFGVKAVDLDDLSSTMKEAESWFCNPTVDLAISGSINFGTLGPGEQGAATFSVENAAESGSGAEVVLAISGKDFYDPSSSGAKCPTSNVLNLQGVAGDTAPFDTGFWYTAVKGAMTTYGAKRIPYGNDITEADPIFSMSTAANQWRLWFSPTPSLQNQALSPGSEVTMTLHLGLPQPCNGQFTDGQIYLWAYTI